MLEHFPTEVLVLLKRDGQRAEFKGLVSPGKIASDDTKTPFESGDEIERKLPNGMAEVFVINDPDFSKGMHGIPDFYNLKVSRKGQRRPTPITNIVNVHTMQHGAQIQQGTHGSTQAGTFTSGVDTASLLDLVTKVRADLPMLPQDTQEEATVYVEAIEKQAKLAKPNGGFIRSSLESLKTVLEAAATQAVTLASVAAVKACLLAHGIPA